MEYERKFPHTALKESSLCLMTSEGDALTGEDLGTSVSDRADVFVSSRPKGFKDDAPPAAAAAAVPKKVAAATSKAVAAAKVPVADEEATIAKLLDMYKNKKFRVAMDACEDLLRQGSGISTRTKAHVLTMLADMNLHAKHLDKARDYAQKNLKLYRTDAEAVLLLARVQVAQEDHDEALDLLEEFMATKSKVLRTKGGEDKVLRAAALMGDCLMALGRSMEAADVLNSHLSMPGADSNANLLVTYAELALRHDKLEEGIRALLKALVIEQRDDRVRDLFAAAVASDQGAQEVLRQLPSRTESASALVFLATIAKDGSALKSAANFYRRALDLVPDSASYALNLMHILEAMDLPEEVMKEGIAFLKANKVRKIGPVNCCTCGDLHDALVDYASRTENDAYLQMDVDIDSDRNIVRVKRVGGDGAVDIMPEPTHTLEESTLDLLAIGFTAVKVLYGMGHLCTLPVLFQLLEPTRAASDKSLHETSIRNEHAYYQCIAWVLAARADNATTYYAALGGAEASVNDVRLLACVDPLTSPVLSQAAANPIYVCGDSHTIPLSWAVLKTGKGPRLLVPKLVTGAKHWHLRPDSKFYPKANFFNVVRSIPSGADTIFILGEIDCREGILVACERGRYKSVDDGIQHTVKIFSKVVERLVKEKNFKVVVHPIPPVLDETRPLVLRYSDVYQAEMNKLRGTTYLDFQDDLVDGAGAFKNVYKLDGTHLHPSYVSLLEREYQ
jgi:tetratricopeptide (TPR) repeat protein